MQVQKRFNFAVVALANLLISFLISTRSAFVVETKDSFVSLAL